MPFPPRQDAQPAYYVMRDQQRSIGVIAEAIDVPYMHLRNALYGQVVPSPDLRTRLPKLLGVPLEDLFSAEMLAREYQPKRGPKR